MEARTSLNVFRIMMICIEDNIAGEKVSEFFQEKDDLRRRHFCRRKVLWKFSGYLWFASKTILRAKKFLNVLRIMMICAQDNFAGEKVFKYFEDNDDLHLRQFCRKKVFEYFQDKDDLQLRQFCRKKLFEYFQDKDDLRIKQNCRRKRLWLFSG